MTRSRITNTVLALGALGALSTLSAQPASAATPAEMMQQCRIRAGQTLSMRLPDIETKYEGQRTDGSHAVNGTGRTSKKTVTFQCSFNKRGSKITRFVVNKPEKTSAPAAGKPTPSKSESDCLAAVASQVGNTAVSTISETMGETATNVLVRVAGAEKPWRCDHDGNKVLRVLYMGEG